MCNIEKQLGFPTQCTSMLNTLLQEAPGGAERDIRCVGSPTARQNHAFIYLKIQRGVINMLK